MQSPNKLIRDLVSWQDVLIQASSGIPQVASRSFLAWHRLATSPQETRKRIDGQVTVFQPCKDSESLRSFLPERTAFSWCYESSYWDNNVARFRPAPSLPPQASRKSHTPGLSCAVPLKTSYDQLQFRQTQSNKFSSGVLVECAIA